MDADQPAEPDFLRELPGDLSVWVEEVWYSRGRLEKRRERVLPSATTDIVANLGPAMRLAEGAGTHHIVGTTVTGLLTRPIVLEHPEVHEAVGLRLTPHGIRGILGIPAAAVRDVVVDLPDIVSSATDELADACLRGTTPQERLSAAIQWCRLRVARFGECGDPLVRWATGRLDDATGGLTIAALQRDSGYGATRFNARFSDELGVTPKTYARLVRFRRALDSLQPGSDLSALAHHLGYSDQAHMNRDFRELGRTTPTEILAARYSSGFTLAE